MSKGYLFVGVLAAAFAGCSTVGQLTVKNHTAKSGQRVMAGQAEPKADYRCEKVAQERHDWGIKGNMDRMGATERVTAAAVEGAAGRGANYAHIMPPSDTSIGGVNINAFKDAQVAYYKCGSLP
ncbi:MAG TPA: hypothetical protein VGX52_18195 [Burkholderiales bacterium]|nr:hypothetical protein [Burkholderiales bacterium]